MIKTFDQYISEGSLGAITIERKPIDKLNQPDTKTPVNRIETGRGGPGRGHAAPYHWQSTTLSFGANPKKNKKKVSKNYVDKFEKFNNKAKKKKIEEQASNILLNVPEEFKAEYDAINQLNDEIVTKEQELTRKKVELNTKTKELQNKIAAKGAQMTKQQQVQSTQSPQ